MTSSPGAVSVLLLSYFAFISLGLPDTVLGVAWPSLRATFGLAQASMGSVLAATVGGYFVSGLLAGRASALLGVGGLLSASTALVATGLVGFVVAPTWPAFVGCGVAVGLGSGAVDAALNTFGAVHFAPRHMNWLHACYSTGAMIGPAIMTAALAGSSYRAGYGVLAVVLGAMAAAFATTRRRWGAHGAAGAARVGSASAAVRMPRVWLQALIFFVYTGLEASAGQWAFTVLREARGLSLGSAGTWTAVYWGSIAAGRIATGFIVRGRTPSPTASRAVGGQVHASSCVRAFGPDALVRFGTWGAVAGTLLYALLPGATGAAGLAALGVSLAPVFPMLMSRTPGRLGHDIAPHAVGFQVSAATLATAAMPTAHGLLADALGAGAIPFALLALAAILWLLCAALMRGDASAHSPEGWG